MSIEMNMEKEWMEDWTSRLYEIVGTASYALGDPDGKNIDHDTPDEVLRAYDCADKGDLEGVLSQISALAERLGDEINHECSVAENSPAYKAATKRAVEQWKKEHHRPARHLERILADVRSCHPAEFKRTLPELDKLIVETGGYEYVVEHLLSGGHEDITKVMHLVRDEDIESVTEVLADWTPRPSGWQVAETC